MGKIRSISSPVGKGARRDWRETGQEIMGIIGNGEKGDKIEISSSDLTGYQEYLLRMGNRFPGVMKGNGPRINGVQTPHHNGDGYQSQRDILKTGLRDEYQIDHNGRGWTMKGKPIYFDITE